MTKLLVVKANPKLTRDSYSLTVGQEFMNAYQDLRPHDEVEEVDLFEGNFPGLNESVFGAWAKLRSGVLFEQLTQEEQRQLRRKDMILEQFMSADKYVLMTPMWNFGLPGKMKDYIDNIAVPGKTFKYTAQGPIGLLQGRRAVHIHSSGGVYTGEGAPQSFADPYLKTIMAFMGITNYESILVEGVASDSQNAEQIKRKAIESAAKAAARFAE